jgi:chemotaxis protein MotB
VLERQRAELLAAHNDLAAAEARLAGKDKEAAALAAAGRELVAAGEAMSGQLAERDAQVAGLRAQLLAVRNDLGAAEGQLAASQRQIAALVVAGRELVAGGERLEAEKEQLQQELAGATGQGKAFFARLREVLGPDTGARVDGDRFVFPADVAFQPGSARLTPAAREKALAVGREIAAAARAIPPGTDWVIRVDGHTDRQAVNGRAFRSNRQLAAARALAVVDVLAEAGVPPDRLAAASFGEFRPLDPGDTPEAYRANRRIELRLDEG